MTQTRTKVTELPNNALTMTRAWPNNDRTIAERRATKDPHMTETWTTNGLAMAEQ